MPFVVSMKLNSTQHVFLPHLVLVGICVCTWMYTPFLPCRITCINMICFGHSKASCFMGGYFPIDSRIVRIYLYHSCLIAVLLAEQLRTQAKLFTECRGQRVSESTGTNSTRNLTSHRARPFLRTAKDTWVTFNHIFRLSPLHQCDNAKNATNFKVNWGAFVYLP